MAVSLTVSANNERVTTMNPGLDCRSFRDWSIWKWSRDYFPVNLVKTEDLDPSKNYVLGMPL